MQKICRLFQEVPNHSVICDKQEVWAVQFLHKFRPFFLNYFIWQARASISYFLTLFCSKDKPQIPSILFSHNRVQVSCVMSCVDSFHRVFFIHILSSMFVTNIFSRLVYTSFWWEAFHFIVQCVHVHWSIIQSHFPILPIPVIHKQDI